MGKPRDLFKKVRDTKGTFHAKMDIYVGKTIFFFFFPSLHLLDTFYVLHAFFPYHLISDPSLMTLHSG